MQTHDSPSMTFTASQSNVTSSLGPTFSYSLSVPCSGSGNSSFTYTDNASTSAGGTFTMQNLASVSCFNSLTSTQQSGNYDTIQFSGFGKWSKDSNPHVATVQVSTAPDAPYVSIQIDGGQTSVLNTKPPTTPVP
jgi:hypothetical protein